MALVADTGAILAIYDADDKHHRRVLHAIKREKGPIIVPTAILAETDYLLRRFLGIEAEIDFVDGVLAGAYTLEPLTAPDLRRCRELISLYRNLDLGLADASVIATAERLAIRRILTVDERDFRIIRARGGLVFELWPADLP